MRYRYMICDVFTRARFGGNQLAVLPDARGLDRKAMQSIAREFNFSESAFVFPPEQGETRKVRIFTPTIEVPFAGHPNIGTAFALAQDGAFGSLAGRKEVTFEEAAGTVPIERAGTIARLGLPRQRRFRPSGDHWPSCRSCSTSRNWSSIQWSTPERVGK